MAFALAAAVAALLVALPRTERIIGSNGVEIAITSKGFPFSISQQLSFKPGPKEPPHQLDLLLPDGTLMQFNKNYVTRPDKTLVHFDKGYATKPNGEIVPLDGGFLATLGGNCRTNSTTLTVRLPGWRPRTYDARQIDVTLLDGTTIGFRLGTVGVQRGSVQSESGSVLYSLTNGADFYYEKDQLTALLPQTVEPTVTTLPNKTQLRFDNGKVDLALPRHEKVHADLLSGRASFADDTLKVRNLHAIGVDIFLVALFAVYIAVCWVRLERAQPRSDSPKPHNPSAALSGRQS